MSQELLSRISQLEAKVELLMGMQDALRSNGLISDYFVELDRRLNEPILKCVHCDLDYKESSNPEGGCVYHPGDLVSRNWKVFIGCCNKELSRFDKDSRPKDIRNDMNDGCKRTKHRSVHHTDFPYRNRGLYFRQVLKTSVSEGKLEFSQPDYDNYYTKQITVGKLDSGDVYVAGYFGTSPLELAVVNKSTITDTDPKNLELFSIMRKSDKKPATQDDPHFAFSATLLHNGQTVDGVEVSVKSISSPTKAIYRIPLSIDSSTDVIVIGKPMTVQEWTPTEVSDSDINSFKVESSSETGPKLSDPTPPKPMEPTCTGSKDLIVQLSKAVTANQGMSDNICNNYFFHDISITNTTSANISIVKAASKYQESGSEEWKDVDETASSSNWIKFPIDIEAGKSYTSFPLRTLIKLEGAKSGNNNRTRQRAHNVLKSPLKFSTVFSLSNGNEVSFNDEFVNPSLNLYTPESYATYHKNDDIVHFCSVDSLKQLDRYIGCVKKSKSAKDEKMSVSIPSRSLDLTYSNLQGQVYSACKKNESSYEILASSSDIVSTVHLLVDLEKKCAYGLKFTLTSKDEEPDQANTISYWKLPSDFIKKSVPGLKI